MAFLILILIFLFLWKVLGFIGRIFLPIIAVLFILSMLISSVAIVSIIWIPIAVLYFIGLFLSGITRKN